MKFIRAFFLLMTSVFSFQANALIIKDVISVNQFLAAGAYDFTFDLTKHGYNHKLDDITLLEITFDFSGMIDEYDNFEDPDNFDSLESIQINSWFDGRMIIHDINPEVFTRKHAWISDDNMCQNYYYNSDICRYNLDLLGNAIETLIVYPNATEPNKIWVGDVTLSVEVNRVPEASMFILCLVGMMGIFGIRRTL